MFGLRSCISRIMVLVLTCLVGAHSVKAQALTSLANHDKKPIPVVNLSLHPSAQVLKDARDVFLRHEIVMVEGATTDDMRRLLGLSLHPPKAPRENRPSREKDTNVSNDGVVKEQVEGILRVIAVRTTPEGQFHVFYGFTSGIKPDQKSGWTAGIKKWVNKESGIKEDTAVATDASVRADSKKGALEDAGDGPDPGAWTHLSTTTNSMTSANQNVALLTATVYRLNSIDPATDYYMVLTDAQDSPNFGSGWVISQRGVDVRAQTPDGTNATLFDHGPTGTLTSTTVGFSVGVGISLLGPSVTATFSANWTQPSVVTTDKSDSFASWIESIGGITPVSTGTFLSHQSAIFVVPGDTTSLSIFPSLLAAFGSAAGPDAIQVDVGPIDAEPPTFSATPTSIVLAPGVSTKLHVVASNSNSSQGLSWNITGNNNTWLSVPSGPFSTSLDLDIAVLPGTSVGTSGFVSVDTDPPFAAKSVESGPIQVQVTVGNAQATTTTLSSSVNPSNSGQNVTFVATVTSTGAGSPTGTVTFRNVLTPLGPAVPLSNGQAMFNTSSLAGGMDSINAAYSGDSNFEGSTSSPLQQIVNGSGTGTVQIIPSTGQAAPYGAETLYVLKVFLASNDLSLPPPTGFYTVNFLERTSGKNVVSFNTVAAGQISFAFPANAVAHAGFYKLVLHYNGDSNYAASDSTPLDVYIAPASTSTALSTNVTSANLGSPVTITASVSAPPFKQISIVPTGPVQFFDGTQPLGIVNLNNNGVAAFTTHTLSAGTHKITATFNGGTGPDGFGNFTNSTNTTNVAVQTNQTQASMTATPNPANFRDAITFQAQVAPQNNQDLRQPTGLVSFKDGSKILGTVLLADGIATFTTSTLPGGPHTITAQYVGDAVFQPDTSANYPLGVNPINSVTNLTLSEPDPGVVYGEFVDLNATITDANNATLVNETGTVTFSYVTPGNPKSQILGTVNLTLGKATFRTSALSAAQYNFLATYNGSGDFNPSSSNPHTFSVNPASTSTAITSPASGTTVNVGQPIVVNFQVAVVPPGGGIISGESVTVQDPNFQDSTCTGKLAGTTSPFTGSCTITPQTSGTRQLKAFFQALVNQNYQQSSSLVVTDINVAPVSPGTTAFSNLTPSQTIAQGSSSIDLSGIIAAPGLVYPPANENVSVTIGSISRSVNIGGKGAFAFNNFPTNTLAAGVYPITYSYAGDSNFSPATNASSTLTVNGSGQGATITKITPSVQQCVSGIPFVLTIQVTSTQGTPDGTVVLVRTNPDSTQTLIGSQTLAGGMWAPAVNSSQNFPMSPGTYSFTATYQGNSTFNSSVGTLGNFKCTAATRK